jgi:hypothetical protein
MRSLAVLLIALFALSGCSPFASRQTKDRLLPQEEAEVRATFLNYQQMLRDGDFERLRREMFDVEMCVVSWGKSREEVQQTLAAVPFPWGEAFVDDVAGAVIESIRVDHTKAKLSLKRSGKPLTCRMAVVKSGDYSWYFHRTRDGWKLYSQERKHVSPKPLRAPAR